jgi:Tn3 transposase DDE domain
MPRMRGLSDAACNRPNKSTRYQHIDALFGDEINWDLIATDAPDMIRVVLSPGRPGHAITAAMEARHIQSQMPPLSCLPNSGRSNACCSYHTSSPAAGRDDARGEPAA